MRNKGVRWLYEELPNLVRQGVLSADAAEALRSHYGPVEEGRWRQIAVTLSGVLGALLIGLGIIFVLGYNWSALGRSVRTALSLAPLLAAQGLAAWVLWRSQPSAAWREGAAVMLALALVASVALIQQTYHVSSDYDELLLPCLVLTLPVVYLLGSSAAAVLYLVGVLAWAGAADLKGTASLAVWLLAIPLAPHVWTAARADRYALRPVFLMWAVALWAGVALGFVVGDVDDVISIVGFPALYAVMVLAGGVWFARGASMWRRPFETVGVAGVAVSAYVLTFRDVWNHLAYHDGELAPVLRDHPAAAALVAALVLASLALAGACLWRRRPWRLVLGAAPALALLGAGVFYATRSASAPAWMFNAYVLALAAAALVTGFRQRRLALANLGVLLVAMLIVARFFDSEMGFLVKGIACIAAGAGFLVTNLVVHRLRRRATP